MSTGNGRLARPAGATVYRVLWAPGSDRLLARCHCGAERVADDPVQVWRWLLAHPNHDRENPRPP